MIPGMCVCGDCGTEINFNLVFHLEPHRLNHPTDDMRKNIPTYTLSAN